MNIVGNSYQSSFYPLPSRDEKDSENALARRKQQFEAEKEQQQKVSQPVGQSEQLREGREVTRIAGLQATNKQYEAKPVADSSTLPNSQQKALKAYAEVDVFSRIDGNTDFLGSIDIIV
ncbi:hypothetical protein A9Q99_23155 [Gammaproteobacteria bacterium 45_16_T64]|nr:hypothetical protein A9Q99_23155 [Gammaproteobacteria bacterium 45_16_T64]